MHRNETSSLARQGLGYFAALDRRRATLWCSFLWYVTMDVRYADSAPSMWLHSLGIAAIVGITLTLNAVSPSGRIRDLGFWPVLLFFLIPFCVASFSVFSEDHAFFLIFPLNVIDNSVSLGLVACFCALVWFAKKTRKLLATAKEVR